ncbi:14615_t:CDS:2, partial [Gigaspora margarita]
TKEFECINSSENNSYPKTTVFGQITLFGSVAGLFFNIAVYGVTSKLNVKKTYQVIAFLGKQRLYIKIKDDVVKDDKDINNEVEDDNDKNNEVKNNETFIKDIQNIYLNFKTNRFDDKPFWETILKLCKEEYKSGKSDYDFIRAILYDLRKRELSEKTEKLMAEKLLEFLEEDEMKKIGQHTKNLRNLLGKSESPKWEVIYSILEFKYREGIYGKKLKEIK